MSAIEPNQNQPKPIKTSKPNQAPKQLKSKRSKSSIDDARAPQRNAVLVLAPKLKLQDQITKKLLDKSKNKQHLQTTNFGPIDFKKILIAPR